MFRSIDGKPDIKYPCIWEYKIFGTDQDNLRKAVAEIITGGRYELTLSRSSRHRKYHCMNLVIQVMNEEDRLEIYHTLSAHEDIVLVL
jgi:uncharacterized protein